ncbi:uridine monophosphate synthetase [Clonorchis sinensis]|uniref:Uridine 5'-monophosphate synthase n=1 Tax=Clonorchis sinensis TaxID=79923 RepID=H2KQC7_CLOSI|nr:uridine monophosphate synthetase [Clonorchis sinensis]
MMVACMEIECLHTTEFTVQNGKRFLATLNKTTLHNSVLHFIVILVPSSIMSVEEKRQLAIEFYNMGVIKFGEFRLKSGILSPVYVDLRLIIASAALVQRLARALASRLSEKEIEQQTLICGVPYSALPIATCISVITSLPMVICRKEAKMYGTKKMVEGVWKVGQQCVIVEDVVTSGASVAAVAELLRSEGICVSRALLLVDREQGGVGILQSKYGISVDSLFRLSELTEILHAEGRITEQDKLRVTEFIRSTPAPADYTPHLSDVTYLAAKQPSLEQLVAQKSSRLCVAIDTVDPQQLLKLADQVGPKVCAIKLHLDMLHFDNNVERIITGLRRLAVQHGFLLVEDRKLADIGQTVMHQLKGGVYRISAWCDLVTVHCLAGPGVFQTLRQINEEIAEHGHNREFKALLVAQMSCKGNLLDASYSQNCLAMCQEYTDILAGFVCQHPLPGSEALFAANRSLFYWVPGVHVDATGDQLSQSYDSPAEILKRFATAGSENVILIVGRGITEASEPVEAAERYRRSSMVPASF